MILRPEIRYYERHDRDIRPWNKPRIAGYWSGGYDEGRGTYAGAQTGSQPQQGSTEEPAWTRGIAEADGVRYCDVMCNHNYTSDAAGYPGDTIEVGLRSVFGAFGHAWFLGDTKTAMSESPAADVTSYVFKGAGRTMSVLSPQPKHAAYALSSAGFDLFANPLPKGSALGKTLVYLMTP